MSADLPVTINKWLQLAQKQLKEAGIHSYPLDSLLLLEYITGYDRAHILAHPEKPITQDVTNTLHELLNRRTEREPLAYILQSCEFFGHNFYVNNNVLVPRPESEAFIELLSKLTNVTSLIDVGCGSGAIGISAKLANLQLDVTLSDVSKSALKVAQENALRLKAKVKLLRQDLLGNHPKHYDVICANLPYVPKNLFVEQELSYEPPIALFSDDDGMYHYTRLWNQVSISRPLFVLTESLKIQHGQQIERAKKSGYAPHGALGLVQLFKLVR